MPSHPDRVRRNYHTLDIHSHDEKARDQLELKLVLAKSTIASFLSHRMTRDTILKAIANELEHVFGRSRG